MAISLEAIGKIRTATGSVSVMRAGGFVVQAHGGELLYQGDVIETVADAAAGLTFNDGTAFNLSAGARMVLDEFICDQNGTANSALFSLDQGTFTVIGGEAAKTGGLWINTPLGRIRGAAQRSGMGVLTLTALTFAVMEGARAANQPYEFLDDDIITFRDLPHGAFEIALRPTAGDPNPRVIVVDNPEQTVVIRPRGSGFDVGLVTNTASQMAILLAASQNAAAVFSLGQQDPFIQQQQRADINQQPTGFLAPIIGSGTVPQFTNLPKGLNPIVTAQVGPGFNLPDTPFPTPIEVVFVQPPPVLGNRAPVLNATTDPPPVLNPVNAALNIPPINGNLPVTDPDVGQTLTPSVVGSPTVQLNGSAFTLPASAAALTAPAAFTLTGATSNGGPINIGFTYNPGPGDLAFLGEGDSLTITYTVQVNDGSANSGTQGVTFTFTGSNDAPIATSSSANVSEEGLTGGVVIVSDVDVTDTLTITLGAPVDALTSGGQPITWEGAGTATLIGKVGTTTIITVTIDNAGNYTVTLGGPIDHSDPASEDIKTITVPVAVSDGHTTTTTTLSVNIVDDVPRAVADTNSVIEGGIVTGNVLTDADDVFGADGATTTVPGGVVGVRAALGNTTTAVTTGIGSAIPGLFGTLTLNADGSYSYDGAPNVVPGATDVFVYTIMDGDGDLSTTTLTISLSDSGITAPADSDVTVNENALDLVQDVGDLAPGTVIGSLPGSAAETDNTSNQLNATSSAGGLSYALQTGGNAATAGLFGTIQVASNGSYVYTLTRPFDTSPDNNNGVTTEVAESFTYVATDANGNTQTGTITVNIVDDVPRAVADTNSVIEGGIVTGNVLTDADDVFGADGATTTVPGGVVGVRAALGNTTTAVTTGIGSAIPGLFGTLTLNADGSYSYDGAPNVVPGATDVFVYTIMDGDGDLSTTTLTISLSDSGITAPADSDVTVNENALDLVQDVGDLAPGTVIGSLPGSAAETDNTSNQLNATSSAGGLSYALQTGGNAATAGLFGTIQVASNGSYVYTLTRPFDTSPDNNNGVTTEVAESFTYVATDANGNTQTGTITVNIVDDVPRAVADTNSVIEGGIVTGNVLTDADDVFGADGATTTVPGGVVGVRAALGNTTTAVTTGIGSAIPGLFGTLTLNADGSYSYDGAPNVVPGATDVFVYTIMDGDGDLSTTTLTISLSDSGITAPADSDVTVNENALDLVQDVGDLAPGTVIGSLPGSAAETDNTSNQLNATSSAGGLSYALQTGGNAATAGLFGTIQVASNGSYVYTLTRPFDTSPDNNNGVTTEVAESFTYVATDANGNTQTGTITVNIVDDVPRAVADTNSVIEGGIVTGNVLTDADDVFGADGATTTVPGGVVGVRAALGNTTTAVTTGIGSAIPGLFGTLTLNADGSYSYDGAPNVVPGATDVFVYTIMDGDGDLSTTTLTISLSDSGITAPADSDVTVNENALDLVQDVGDLAPGTVIGSLPGSAAETDNTSNQLNATSSAGGLSYALQTGGNAATAGLFGTIQVASNGSYVYTLTRPFDTSPDNNNGVTTEVAESFTYVATDANGNTQTGTITVNIVDDVPRAVADTNSVIEGGIVTGNVLTDADDVFGADGATTTVPGGVVGVRAALGNTTTAVTTGIGSAIPGLFGTLTLNADGSYSYDGAPNVVPGATDVFVYTIMDGDGDLSTTTLTISLSDSGITAPADSDVTVNENALDLVQDVGDLAPGTVIGSLPGSAAETDNTSNQLNATSSAGGLSYALQTGGNAATAGLFGTIQVASNGSYVYTLTRPFDTSPDNNNGVTTEVAESFTYVATDANGNTQTGTITVNIVDDVPRAVADTNSVIEGGIVTGNVLTDADDVFGADGATTTVPGGVVGVRAALGNTTTAVTTGIGSAIPGLFGTLTLNADGSYSYDGAPNVVPGATDVFVYTIMDGDGDLSTTTLTISLSDSGITAPADSDVTVNENALDLVQDVGDLAPGTVIGSLPGSAAETDNTSNQLNATSSAGGLSYALQTGGNAATAGLFGTIQVASNGSYVYTLTRPFDTSPDNNNGVTTEVAESFTYVATDANGNTQTGTITVNIVDDVPRAVADTNSVIEGGIVTGNVLTDADDVFGADGATTTVPGGVVGVRAALGNTTTAVTTGIGSAIPGLFGTLTLNADGSYSYDGAPNVVPGATDVFVYTIMDGDGDLSTTTLTISLSDSGITAPADSDVTVNENALDLVQDVGDLAPGTVIGSLPGSAAETDNTSNQLNATSSAGGLSYALQTGGNAATAGLFGTIQVASNGSYVYTLTRPFDTSPDNNNGVTTEVAESFTYVATDANGNTQTGTITVNIVDDVPRAVADTNSVIEGGIVTGNVLTDADDVFGADGATTTVPGGVVGVRAALGNTTTAVTTGIGSAIPGLFGTLTLNADGSYSYDGAPNVVPGATDVFVYTIMDGDGDLSTTTLTISLSDSGITAPADSDVTVNENALDLVQDVGDLAPGTVIGSLPGSAAETDNTSNQLNATSSAGGLSYALQTGGNAATAGLFGTIQVASNGSYVYTLTRPFDTSPDNNNGVTTEVAESFTYVATDANGNTQTGTITVNIVDDVPRAVADTNSVIEGGIVTGNVLTDADDVFGADGATTTVPGGVVGVRAALGNTTTAVTTGIGSAIPGLFGTLTLNADGSYSYDGAPNVVPGATDVFVYTIMDGDGDLSTTTLTISLSDSGITAPADSDVTVNENALDLVQDVGDLAPGTVIGSLPGSAAETDNTSNQLNATSSAGGLSYALQTGGNAATAGLFGTIQVASNGSYVYTLTRPFDTSPDNNNGVTTEVAESFTYVATDANGNTQTGTITVNIVDDVPRAVNNTAQASQNQAGAQNDLLLIVDASGSMFETVPGVASNFGFGNHRIELARLALLDLVNQANVDEVKIIQFGGSATTTVWMTKAAAFAYIMDANNFPSRADTDYDAALAMAKTAFSTPPATTNQRLVHFLSDGVPTEENGTGSLGISEADTNNAGFGGLGEELHWIKFLTDNNVIKSTAIGIGGLNATTANNLEPIAWQSPEVAGTFAGASAAAQDANVKIVSEDNLFGLGSTLVSAVPGSQTGNLLSDQVPNLFGADGGRICPFKSAPSPIRGTVPTRSRPRRDPRSPRVRTSRTSRRRRAARSPSISPTASGPTPRQQPSPTSRRTRCSPTSSWTATAM